MLTIDEVKEELEKHKLQVVSIGDGDTITKQFPEKGSTVLSGDKVFLVTIIA